MDDPKVPEFTQSDQPRRHLIPVPKSLENTMDVAGHLSVPPESRPTVFPAKGSNSPTPVACDARNHHHESHVEEAVSANDHSSEWGFDRDPKP